MCSKCGDNAWASCYVHGYWYKASRYQRVVHEVFVLVGIGVADKVGLQINSLAASPCIVWRSRGACNMIGRYMHSNIASRNIAPSECSEQDCASNSFDILLIHVPKAFTELNWPHFAMEVPRIAGRLLPSSLMF